MSGIYLKKYISQWFKNVDRFTGKLGEEVLDFFKNYRESMHQI